MGQDRPNGNCIFQKDLMPCHTSQKMRTIFEGNELDVLEWHGIFPNLNLIENLWALVELRFQGEHCMISTKLISDLIKDWYYEDDLAETR